MAAKSSETSDKPKTTRRKSTKRPKKVEASAEDSFEKSETDALQDEYHRKAEENLEIFENSHSSKSEAEPEREHESMSDTPAESVGDDNSERTQSDQSDKTGGNRRRRRRRRKPDGTNTAPANQGQAQGQGQNRQGGGNRGRSNNSNSSNNRGGNRSRTGGRNQARRPRSTSSAANENISGTIEGVLELHPKAYGFIRDPKVNYKAQDSDAFVSSSLIEKHNLREGILIRGEVGPGTRGQGPRLKTIETIDGRTVEEYMEIKCFEELTPVNPFEQIKLETGPMPITMRIMDLLTPIGKGQRALVVAPPRTGKTMLLQDIAEAVSKNHPEIRLMVLLIDERPEEVTEMERSIKGEVISSSMDRDVESHVRTSQLIFERGKRLAEAGEDAFILLDSITRTARAFNKWVGNTGRTMSGGLDVKAMDLPKKMFGTARRFDEGGSLTVLGTALIDTGSRMDEVIFQEFKGTGNMEMVLSRELSDRRIFPSIDITLSGTRREEKILDPEVLDGVTMLRRSLISLSPVEAMEQLGNTLKKFPTNSEFLEKIRAIL
ncbi:transcription termination factor Rho [uncultured Gimesia sp.]|uniref:transcription termination factor Rho n=1 Tax=uncultured Gimesia sp. TaxID=1678688 RepID=UPI00260792CD|nr:transcription termination factor Rho [uncultured Gimesia sp.]